MKILILSNYGLGLYKFRKELIQRLCFKHNVYLALPSGDFISELEALGCTYLQFEFERRNINPFDEMKQIVRYVKLIKKIRPEVVLAYTIKPNVYGGIACQMTRVPYISNVTGLGTSIENGGILGFISIALYKIALKKACCVFFQNDENRNFFIDKGIVNGKTRLIPGSGVNLKTHCLEEYPIEEGIRFLFIGRIMKDKGIGELLQAMKIIHCDYSNTTLDIVGGCDEDYGAILEDACSWGYIRYYGLQKEVHQFIKNSHCTILPSYHEGLANVMIESASTGRPVITTNVSGCKETFDEGVSGFGCKARDVSSLVNAMECFIKMPYAEKRKMGLNGRAKMYNEFDRNIVIDAYIEEIKKIEGEN